MFSNIPKEIQNYPQWINWKYSYIDGKTTKIPIRSIDGKNASVTDPRDWTTFEAVCIAAQFCDGIGFVFTTSDPFTGFDFDAAIDPNIIANQKRIYEKLSSYAELSPSGKGVHVIVKAKLDGKGRRRNGVECYDNARFFTFTGNTINSFSVVDRQIETIEEWNLLGNNFAESIQIQSQDEVNTDKEIIERASSAANGAKFDRLNEGMWEGDYGSQSEADFSLINIFAFYTRNSEQITRLFRASGLGQREKAKRGSYVGLMVRRAFDRVPPTILLPDTAGSTWFNAATIEPWLPTLPLALTGPYVPPPATEPQIVLPPSAGLPTIPGLLGDFMRQCFHSSVYPIKEVALASAITSMSLLCGRTHRVGTQGLSLYVLLLAKTSVGKDFAYISQHKWRAALRKRYNDPTGGMQYKARAEFLSNMITGKIGSGPGIEQHLIKFPSSLLHLDEFVNEMVEMARPVPNANLESIKNALLTIYNFGKPGVEYTEKRYSQRGSKDNGKLNSVMSASLSILATGTPSKFYDNIQDDMLETGFIPRFTVIEYDGTRPDKNENIIQELDRDFISRIDNYFNQLFNLNESITGQIDQITEAVFNENGKNAFNVWYNYCDRQLKAAHNEGLPTSGIWSRADLHVQQIAALIAVGVNLHSPVITGEYVRLAIDIIKPGLEKLTGNIANNEAGSGDNRCEAEIRKCIRRIVHEGYDVFKSYPNLMQSMCSTGYIQLGAIRWYVTKRSAFKSNKLGVNRAFSDAITAMIKNGDLLEYRFKNINGREVVGVKESGIG